MGRKTETIIHPLAALEAISGYHRDVGFAIAAVQTAVSFLEDESLDPAKVRKAITPSLKDAVERIQRWYNQGDQA